MIAIFIFPFLIFPIIGGRWKVLVYWFMIYFSVLLWTPIWTLLYHIVVSIAQSADIMTAFGKLNDGISLYSAELITSRMYHLFEVYSWLQLLIGTLFTGGLLVWLRPMLQDSERDSAPDFIDDSRKATSTVTGAVSTVAGAAGALL